MSFYIDRGFDFVRFTPPQAGETAGLKQTGRVSRRRREIRVK